MVSCSGPGGRCHGPAHAHAWRPNPAPLLRAPARPRAMPAARTPHIDLASSFALAGWGWRAQQFAPRHGGGRTAAGAGRGGAMAAGPPRARHGRVYAPLGRRRSMQGRSVVVNKSRHKKKKKKKEEDKRKRERKRRRKTGGLRKGCGAGAQEGQVARG